MSDIAIGPEAAPARGRSVVGDWWAGVDRWSLGALLMLFCIGFILVLAASPPLAYRNDLWAYHYVVRQLVFATAAAGLIIVVSMCSVRLVRRGGVLLFLAAFAATAALPWAGTDFGKGAVRWYSLGLFSLQPSEFLKPSLMVTAAWLMSGSFQRSGPPGRSLSAILALGCALMLAAQPDFGQAMLLMAVWTVMVFVSGAPILLLLGLGVVIVAGGVWAYATSEHFQSRIDGFLAADIEPNTQLGYALSAIREGGLFGVGAAQGSVKWTLPDAHTDFIIAVAAEEYGLLMVLLILGLYLLITLRSLIRLAEERDPFVRLAGTGLALLFGLQAFINMGVAIRLLPAKGMTLPFISYGGSSMLAGGLLMGALLALTRLRPRAGPALP